MLPGPLLLYSIRQGQVLPRLLTLADEPWLRQLIDLHDAFVGKRRIELDEALRAAEPVGFARRPHRAAARLLGRMYTGERPKAGLSRRVRSTLFAAAAGRPLERDRILAEVARESNRDPAELESALFADLAHERPVEEPQEAVVPADLALRCNLANAQGLLYRAAEVDLILHGNARRVVHYARLRGLICTVGAEERDPPGVQLHLSGPFSLFRRTLVYGRALGGMLPQLMWCKRFHLRAGCTLPSGTGALTLKTGAPIFPASEPKRYDSQIEQRFARDMGRATREWELVREPQPIEADGTLIYPDFMLVHTQDPRRRWLIEIVGFWTADYLRKKLARLRHAELTNLLLCVDAARACSRDDLPPNARVIRYKGRIDPREVLERIGAGNGLSRGDQESAVPRRRPQ